MAFLISFSLIIASSLRLTSLMALIFSWILAFHSFYSMEEISEILLKFSKFNSGNNLASLLIFLLMVLRCSGLDLSWTFLISEKMFIASLRLLKIGVWPLFMRICLLVRLIFFVGMNFLLTFLIVISI